MWTRFPGTETEDYYPIDQVYCLFDSKRKGKFYISTFHYLREINVCIERGTRIGLL